MRNRNTITRRGTGIAAAGLAAAVLLGACDFEVTNPGPVQDEFLDEPAAAEAIVVGMNRTFNDAFNEIARRGGSSPRELFPAGNTGRIGISTFEGRGIYRYDDVSGEWSLAQNARWVADRGIERLEEVLENPSSSPLVAEAALWGGYSYRFNGEHFCQAVINGSAAMDHTVYFDSAQSRFTRAMDVAESAAAAADDAEVVEQMDSIALAAQAGRASVRVHLGDWAGAAEDAQAVIDADPDFEFATQFYADEEDQYNHFYYATEGAPYRVYSVWSTPHEEYYEDTGDPRAGWTEHPEFEFGDQPKGDVGAVPFLVQTKYTSRTDPVRLSSAREMHLILAEADIRNGNHQAAVDRINDELRATVTSDQGGGPIPEWDDPAGADDAWETLIRERGIELWLEGRRLGDFRRWLGVEGFSTDLFHPLEIPPGDGGEAVYLSDDRDLCYPIGQSEMETNPNIDLPGT